MLARWKTNWCINWVLMRVIDAVRETIADVSSASPLSERLGLGFLLWQRASARNVSYCFPHSIYYPHQHSVDTPVCPIDILTRIEDAQWSCWAWKSSAIWYACYSFCVVLLYWNSFAIDTWSLTAYRLENALRSFACLTKGDIIAIKYNDKVWTGRLLWHCVDISALVFSDREC